jgi:hypothetical protein
MIARMNLRQAAALALGWYLMTAPIKKYRFILKRRKEGSDLEVEQARTVRHQGTL